MKPTRLVPAFPLPCGCVSQADPSHLRPHLSPPPRGPLGGAASRRALEAALGPKPAGLGSDASLPSDVRQHEYSYFLFKTNLEFWLSKGLLITEKRLRQELIDRPTWPLLKNKLAMGRPTDKGKRRGWVFMSC